VSNFLHTQGVDVEKPLEFEQGDQFHYSQLGFELLSKILEKKLQVNFEQSSTELFKPKWLKKHFSSNNKTYKIQ
jgi:hypothetical protein